MTKQLNLFDDSLASQAELPGLVLVQNFISEREELALLKDIDSEIWLDDLSRRVQHYGYRYDYRARKINNEMQLGKLPNWIVPIVDRLKQGEHFDDTADQVIVNEYLPGQGISPHVDCEPCFDDTIASLSLGSGATMKFEKADQVFNLYLPRRSLVLLRGESRYLWKHSIPKRKSDKVGSSKLIRGRRISLTFRRVILE